VSGKSETIVVDGRGVTVYELGGESLAKLECVTRTCFNTWPPLRVPSAATHVHAGPGVPGNVSILQRVKGGFYQVMLDRHPVYYYSGDHGRKGPTGGQGMTSFGGTWHVVKSG
jgi:predicted lipoprotein with Yx(FWY)xxD motif